MGRVTMTDIARAVGVSQTTVSVVLNDNKRIHIPEETRNRIMEAADGMGYKLRPRAPRTSKRAIERRGLIGLMMPNLNNLFFTDLVRYIERFAWKSGYEVVLSNIERQSDREGQRLKALIDMNVDGIIMAYTPRDIDNARQIARRLPLVVLGESPTNCALHTIGINGYRCGELMIKHLCELGHRDIVMLTAPVSNISLTRPRRIEGARSYLSRMGSPGNFFVIEDDYEAEDDNIYEFEMGYKLTRQLLSSGRKFSAIMASDMCAPGIYEGLKQAGLSVPEDVSVVGIDNIFVGRILSPALTTIDHHMRERSRLAVDRLIDLIHTHALADDGYLIEYSPSLIVRQSTAPCADAPKRQAHGDGE